MLSHSFRLFQLFGIEIRINPGWAVIAALIAWSLAQGVFPDIYSGLATTTYWVMAAITVFGLAVSIIAHELAHALVAARFGSPVSSITLFMFGGVAALDKEPKSPIGEFMIALAGPAMSLILACGLYALSFLTIVPSTIADTARYLALLNLVLAIFNLMPAFPMDGGRAFRAIIWGVTGNKNRATLYASQTGKLFGLLFMGLGFLAILTGNFIGGLWWILIGGFVRAAAAGEYERLRIMTALKGQTVNQFMTVNVDTVPGDLSLRDFVDNYLYTYGHDVFPVLRDGQPIGIIGLAHLKSIKQKDWIVQQVQKTMTPLSPDLCTSPLVPAHDALRQMIIGQRTRLLVIDKGHLVGVLVLKDLLDHLAIRLALEPDAALEARSV